MVKKVDNYEAKIWLGLKEGYEGKLNKIEDVEKEIQEYVNKIYIGLTMTPIKFFYPSGSEDGVVIGLINYARFPRNRIEIQKIALELGEILMKKFNQYRISVTFYPVSVNGSIMLENEELEEK